MEFVSIIRECLTLGLKITDDNDKYQEEIERMSLFTMSNIQNEIKTSIFRTDQPFPVQLQSKHEGWIVYRTPE